MHYAIIGIVILVIIYLQVKAYSDTKKRLKTYSGIFPKEVGEQYRIGKNGLILDIQTEESIKKEIDELDKQIKEAQTAVQTEESIKKEIDELNRRITVAESISATSDYIGQLKTKRDELKSSINCLPPMSNGHVGQLKKKRDELKKSKNNITTIQSKGENSIWDKILSSINRYLEKNKGSVSDFHLIKDIVDRNCDAEEEAIQTQVPMPLYYGLMGTMAGIIVGVGYLWLSHGLEAMLSTAPNATNIATNGIVALLGGVALAMICSIVGIILTTGGSSKLKDAKISVEERKHEFLSWMQAELLPKLNNDIADVLTRVTSELTDFNETFSENADKLKDALDEVNQATSGQAKLLSAIDKLKISRIVSANIEVYDKLKNCTDEIGLISEQLQCSRAYLQEVRALNERLDNTEQRTRAIEDMAFFFKEERGNIKSMQSVLNQTTGEIQTNLKSAIENLKQVASDQITELVAHTTEQRQRLQAAIDEQDKVLEQKTAEINQLVASLGSVGKMVEALKESANKQSQAIDTLSRDIRDLAMQKTSGTITVKQEKMPRWAKILIIIGGSIVVLYCLLSILGSVLSVIYTV